MKTLKLMALLAHPDDESLGFGGTLAKYSAEGVETHVVIATRGQAGRHGGEGFHPGPEALGRIREAELQAAARELGIHSLSVLDYMDAALDRAEPATVISELASLIRRVRPQVVLTFAHDGSYGHPDHIAICQFSTAAIIAAAKPSFKDRCSRPHAVSKLYYLARGRESWEAYQRAFKKLTSTVDGEVREASLWPEWSITTRIDAREYWPTVWRAIQYYKTQLPGYPGLADVSDKQHESLWGLQSYYRVFSSVNGGRTPETDLFEGLRDEEST